MTVIVSLIKHVYEFDQFLQKSITRELLFNFLFLNFEKKLAKPHEIIEMQQMH